MLARAVCQFRCRQPNDRARSVEEYNLFGRRGSYAKANKNKASKASDATIDLNARRLFAIRESKVQRVTGF